MSIQVYMHLLLFLNTCTEETIKVLSKTHLPDIIKGSMSHPKRHSISFYVPFYYKKKCRSVILSFSLYIAPMHSGLRLA